MNLLNLNGKNALITGSVGGIGHAIAVALAEAGCNIVLHGIESEKLASDSIKKVEKLGVKVIYIQADLQHVTEIESMFQKIIKDFGSVDILVNNAVTRHFASIETFPVEKWDLAMAVNVSAVFHLVRLALPVMRKNGWGRIINMTSVYGMRGTPNRIDYVASKSAIAGMTRGIAAELVHDNITCNALCPGSVLTPNIDTRIKALMQQSGLTREEAEKEFLKGKQPGGKTIPAEYVARQALYLCEDSAQFINGSVLPMEDGWLAF